MSAETFARATVDAAEFAAVVAEAVAAAPPLDDAAVERIASLLRSAGEVTR